MKMLRKLKLGVLGALMLGGMSSCLDNEDFLGVGVFSPYILQTESGKFVPQMRVSASDRLKSVSIEVEGQKFLLEEISENIFEVNPLSVSPLDSVKNGYSTVTAIGMDGKVENVAIGFSLTAGRIGEILFKEGGIKWDEAKSEITFELADSVANAKEYYLVFKSLDNPESMWFPYGRKLELKDGEGVCPIDINGFSNGSYLFSVGAAQGTTLRISQSSSVRIEVNRGNL